jgi:excisionase family DNA binding protein
MTAIRVFIVVHNTNNYRMTTITHNTLPEAVQLLIDKIDNLERVFNSKSDPPPLDNNDLINAEQAALYLGKAQQTIYGLVSRKKIPHIGKGKNLRFSKAELKNWLIKLTA